MTRKVELTPDEIIAEFQRRRRRYRKIVRLTFGIAVVGIGGGLVLMHSLAPFNDPRYWIFTGIGAAMLVFVCGAIYAPLVYCCPNCKRIVQIRDPLRLWLRFT